jgi:PAS domain S-box-containing protein
MLTWALSGERTGMEDDLRRIVDALPGLIWTALSDGHVDFLNQRWCQYTGLRADEAQRAGWQAAIHPADLPSVLELGRLSVASGTASELEARLRRFDERIAGFCSRSVRSRTPLERSTNRAKPEPISTTGSVRRRSSAFRRKRSATCGRNSRR